MLKDIESISRLLCAFQGLNFEMEVPEKLPDHVIGDHTRILQAVLYMLGNVLCLGDGGSFVLCVSSINSTDTNCLKWKQLTYKDSALLKFEVCRTNSKEYDPSSSEEIREKHNSETANPGFLASIHVKGWQRLPIHPSEGCLIEPRCMDPQTAGCLFKGMETLLADSDSFNRSITRKLMTNLGCHLTVVSSWCQCKETLQLRGSHFHLLLIEDDLLEEDGKQIFAWIRKLSLRSLLRVVALTSESNWDIQSWCLHHGTDGVIRKPVILEELEDVLQRVFLLKEGTPFPFLQNPD
ncbi:Protein EIN4 [Vitis vinifera]|uniref:Protein EIN4 n=1 Tax=Vitis vinifera TaxID=29760 RepID=A0A438G138_VITVI|nr:Protein EIN4 [Vitis vinifera]